MASQAVGAVADGLVTSLGMLVASPFVIAVGGICTKLAGFVTAVGGICTKLVGFVTAVGGICTKLPGWTTAAGTLELGRELCTAAPALKSRSATEELCRELCPNGLAGNGGEDKIARVSVGGLEVAAATLAVLGMPGGVGDHVRGDHVRRRPSTGLPMGVACDEDETGSAIESGGGQRIDAFVPMPAALPIAEALPIAALVPPPPEGTLACASSSACVSCSSPCDTRAWVPPEAAVMVEGATAPVAIVTDWL